MINTLEALIQEAKDGKSEVNTLVESYLKKDADGALHLCTGSRRDWLAKIDGTSKTYGLSRAFIPDYKKDDKERYPVESGVIYDFSTEVKYGKFERALFIIVDDKPYKVEEVDAKSIMKHQEEAQKAKACEDIRAIALKADADGLESREKVDDVLRKITAVARAYDDVTGAHTLYSCQDNFARFYEYTQSKSLEESGLEYPARLEDGDYFVKNFCIGSTIEKLYWEARREANHEAKEKGTPMRVVSLAKVVDEVLAVYSFDWLAAYEQAKSEE
ncbi:hypothetical protein CJI52_05805 [Bifidobacteriaceae bacterium WP022]|nr:hypothetical protein CJI52_05805 [Bifidobacteriaceae bacterium WP022]DAY37349.1 MAG TPA: hypothetical protein [Caudoviricetes sp.]